jgi:hypothetical protein
VLLPVALSVSHNAVLPRASTRQRFAADTADSDNESGGRARSDALLVLSPAGPGENDGNSYVHGASVADKPDRLPLD